MASILRSLAFFIAIQCFGGMAMDNKPADLPSPENSDASVKSTADAAKDLTMEDAQRRFTERRRHPHASIHGHHTSGTMPSRRRRGPVPNRQGEFASDEDIAFATGAMGGVLICFFCCCCTMAKGYRQDGHLKNYTQSCRCVTGDECIGCGAVVEWDIMPDEDDEEEEKPKKKKKGKKKKKK